MAQRAIININGDLIPFSEDLDRIRTPGLGGSAVTWVPDADTICDQLKVTANGTYSAAEAGKYGYDYVVVSVPGSSVTGRDPDTGEEVEVHPDPETGEIVTTVLPTEIRVITPPAKTDYADGETIDYSGIVVHAYSSTGQDMGAVPFNELVFPVTTADASSGEWTDGAGLNAKKIAFMPKGGRDIYWQETIIYVAPVMGSRNDSPRAYASYQAPCTLIITRYKNNDNNYGLRLTGQGEYWTCFMAREIENEGLWTLDGSDAELPADGRFHYMPASEYLTQVPVSTVDPTTIDPTTLHATQSLPVQWPRTPDGAVLETSFNINVTGGST